MFNRFECNTWKMMQMNLNDSTSINHFHQCKDKIKISLKPSAGFSLTIDISFFNSRINFSKMTLYPRVNLYSFTKSLIVVTLSILVYFWSIQNGYGELSRPSAGPWSILSNVVPFKNSNPSKESHFRKYLEFWEFFEFGKFSGFENVKF